MSAFHPLTVTGVNEWTISLKTALKAMKILQTVPVVAVVPSWMNLSRHDKCFFGPCWTPRHAKSFLRGVIISVSVSSELVTKGGVRTRTHQIYFYMKWKDINIARSVYQRLQKRLPRYRPPNQGGDFMWREGCPRGLEQVGRNELQSCPLWMGSFLGRNSR